MSYQEKSESAIELAEAKLIGALANLTWIIPALFGMQMLLELMGYSVGSPIGESLARIMVNLLWIIVILRIIPAVYKFFMKTMEANK